MYNRNKGAEVAMSQKILICDDEPDARVWMKARVRSFGYEVIEASNGIECLEKVAEEQPDLIVLDINMPEMDGFQVCGELRKAPQTRFLPVIMLTAHHTQVNDRVHGLKLGADDYLPKDVDPAEFQARVEATLRRAMTAGDINPVTRLPGNPVITEEIDRKIIGREKFAVAWADLDNFKAYNDRYGFTRGDEMIRGTAEALQEALNRFEKDHGFLGHLGGDDFVYISHIDNALAIGEAAARIIDDRFPLLYDLEDRTRGYIRSVDRQGNPQTFPIATISIAIVNSAAQRFQNVLQVAEAAGEMKKVAKQQAGSSVVVDRRVH